MSEFLTVLVVIIIFLVTFSFLVVLIIYCFFSLLSDFLGAPFVPTASRLVDEILQKANLKKGQIFLELGSGDGRVVRFAAKKYAVYGIGVEFNPLLLVYSKWLAKFEKLKSIEFKRDNFFKINFGRADVIFIFLMPKTLEKLKEKFLKECQKGTLIISHGFKIKGFERYMIDWTDRKTFSTYYYEIK